MQREEPYKQLDYTPGLQPHHALWTLYEQRGKQLVRISPLELPYHHALTLWADELVAYGFNQCQYQRKLRPSTLHTSGKLAVAAWQGAIDASH